VHAQPKSQLTSVLEMPDIHHNCHEIPHAGKEGVNAAPSPRRFAVTDAVIDAESIGQG
jgi:hypothetical protein